MSKDAIVEKILSDAQIKAQAILNEAQEKADEILADAASICKQQYDRLNFELDRTKKDIATRSHTVAELDAKKVVLSAKAELVNQVYARALEKARNLDKDVYKKLILGMLAYAEDGDVVTISEREKDVLTKEDVDKVANEKGIKLSLSDKFGDFDGGIVLSNNGIDKNFTLEVEISLIRDETEAEIAKGIAN